MAEDRQWPAYRSHKVVRAVKVKAVHELSSGKTLIILETGETLEGAGPAYVGWYAYTGGDGEVRFWDASGFESNFTRITRNRKKKVEQPA